MDAILCIHNVVHVKVQRINSSRLFSPSTMQVIRIKLRQSGLHAKSHYPLNHLAIPRDSFIEYNWATLAFFIKLSSNLYLYLYLPNLDSHSQFLSISNQVHFPSLNKLSSLLCCIFYSMNSNLS